MKKISIFLAIASLVLLVGCEAPQQAGTANNNARQVESPATQGSTAKPVTETTISKEEAKNIALTHAGVQAQDVRAFEIEIDTENGILIYEIEFHSGVYEYEYDIHAKTGAVLKFSRER